MAELNLDDVNASELSSAFRSINQKKEGEESHQNQNASENKSNTEKQYSNLNSVQSLDFILDIPLKLTVELGRSRLEIREVLQLSQGSVIELSKFVGEPLEVLVNEKLIARGEVVVVNEKFGVRLIDIISPIERINQLK